MRVPERDRRRGPHDARRAARPGGERPQRNPKPRATPNIDELVEAALQAREPLLRDKTTNAYRVFNGAADGVAGFILERFGATLIAQIHEGALEFPEEFAREIAERFAQRLEATAVYRKVFARDRNAALAQLEATHHDPQPWIGTPTEAEIEAMELGVKFIVRPYDGYSTGLFLDQRMNRRRVRQLAPGRRVLNTFAYTCGFSLAAALGGAVETVSVDISGKSLEWGQRNFAANDVAGEGHTFFRADVFDFLRGAAKRERQFDLIILDPPTFARVKGKRGAFVLEEQLDALLGATAAVLAPGGSLLISINTRRLSRAALEAAAGAALPNGEIAERPRLPLDFRGDSELAKSIWVRNAPS